MTEITILSGKGGTGKTSLSAALASLAENSVFCDNDVDASDMHLLLNPVPREKHDFEGGRTAEIHPDKCIQCGICMDHCRYDAISRDAQGAFRIDPFQCEGCRLCERVCPENAITSTQEMNNHWFVSDTRFGTLVHATMAPGEENSGRLVTQIRQRARTLAKETNCQIIINDGPPGIGCPVIASVTGTNLVIIVLEPSRSSLHDARRLTELVQTFNIPVWAVINKADLHEDQSEEIRRFLEENGIPLLTSLPFDRVMVEAMIHRKTIMEYAGETLLGQRIHAIWQEIYRFATTS